MIGNAAAIAKIIARPRLRQIQLVVISTAAFWALFGFLTLAGALRAGHFSAIGSFSLMGAVYCLLSAAQFGARS